MMDVIVITRPEFIPGEAEGITMLLESGLISRVHIRKPCSHDDDIASLIDSVPPQYHQRLSLHDGICLADSYNIGGIHLGRRNMHVPASFRGLVSKSCHSFEEMHGCDYYFLSPVFDSISKPGYKSAWSLDELQNRIGRNVFALGGVEPEKLPLLSRYGFSGAAMLGAAWSGKMTEFLKQIEHYKKRCSNL